MQIQRSFKDEGAVALYVVPTPIGNLEDITLRALRILKEVSVIAAEDTRNTKKLLNHFDIRTPLISYHEHSKESREIQLLSYLEEGKSVAIVSDAGMPTISDPGHRLIEAAIEKKFPIIVLPGANAALCALVGSGLSTKEFLFYGFLPRKKREKEEELKRLKELRATVLFYESPFRLTDTLKTMEETLGDRNVTVARELTKKFEEYVRGSIGDILKWSKENQLRGEFCLVVEGSRNDEEKEDNLWWSHLSVNDHVLYYVEKNGLSTKEAIKKVAKERNMNRREVYQMFHKK